MPTIEECITQKLVRAIPTALSRWDCYERLLCAPRHVFDWMNTVLPTLQSTSLTPGAATPQQQAKAFIYDFVAGRPFAPPLPHPMRPIEDGVWRLRTDDLRLIGWFPQKNVFVVSDMIDKASTLAPGVNEKLLHRATGYRNHLNMNDKTYLVGELEDLTDVS